MRLSYCGHQLLLCCGDCHFSLSSSLLLSLLLLPLLSFTFYTVPFSTQYSQASVVPAHLTWTPSWGIIFFLWVLLGFVEIVFLEQVRFEHPPEEKHPPAHLDLENL